MTLRQSIRPFVRIGRWVYSKSQPESSARCFSSAASPLTATQRRSELFSAEKKRQREAVGRIEKIEVDARSDFGDYILAMNKDLSTPHDCAKHISKHVAHNSYLALLDSQDVWDMHRPLPASCKLQFLKTIDQNPWVVNNAFWRSCSFMLGAVVSQTFRDDVPVYLHSFPAPNLSSGSFVVDAYLGLDLWNPTPAELREFSKEMIRLSGKNLPFERLSVSEDLAKEMFSDNPYKTNQIPDIFEKHGEIIVYRVGHHVDISRGPMMNHTGLMSRCTIASVHYLKEDQLYRFQGVALPRGHKLNHYAYGILEKRAAHLNEHMIPSRARAEFNPTPQLASEAKEVSY